VVCAFWDETQIVVVFDDAVFEVDRNDRETWTAAIQHGMAQGVTERELDFLTD
jgi:hypothetical protein